MERQAEALEREDERRSEVQARAVKLEADLRALRARERLLLAQEVNSTRVALSAAPEQWVAQLEQWTQHTMARVAQVEQRLLGAAQAQPQ